MILNKWFLSGSLWVARQKCYHQGLHWHDCPPRVGSWWWLQYSSSGPPTPAHSSPPPCSNLLLISVTWTNWQLTRRASRHPSGLGRHLAPVTICGVRYPQLSGEIANNIPDHQIMQRLHLDVPIIATFWEHRGLTRSWHKLNSWCIKCWIDWVIKACRV